MSQSTRDRIVAEASRLFGQQGFAATSVREVVDAADVSKPTLYYHFQSKEQLLEACLQQQVLTLRALVDGALAQPGDLRERLLWFVRIYVGGALERPDSVWLVISSFQNADGPGMAHLGAFRAEVDRLATLFTDVRDGVDALLAARMLCSSADLLVLEGITGTPPTETTYESVVDLFLHGVTP